MNNVQQKTIEQEEKRWLAVKTEVASMAKDTDYSNSDIRRRICALWSIYLGDDQINNIRGNLHKKDE